ncbi:MAG: hypothetical protein LPJ89_01835, partial [Hymenobacteraceae bacterium]|nr:hypothetical protein [Hymenobacteraceae bacterium]
MIFKRLELGLFIRFVFIFGVMYLTVQYLVQYTWVQVVTACLILLLQVWELARYVTRSNTELSRFLQAVKQRDFSQQYAPEKANHSLKYLYHTFNQINKTYQELHLEKEG